ncbi:MAG: Sua5/YciO/YrdC/YwlC family protein [Myxococcales bacterium]|nr:Sua5/YciO/YrdC/YwlC family protein [Myxococcales bacterium]
MLDGGVVCIPHNGRYRVIADFTSSEAVDRLLQAKRRTRGAPTLVLISEMGMLETVARPFGPLLGHLAARLWPGELTILGQPAETLDRRIIKSIGGNRGRLGVRLPTSPVLRSVISASGRPLLVSSANKERKQGAHSPAQVLKTFSGRIDLFVDAGDLTPGDKSTIIALKDGGIEIVRQGALDEARIRDAVAVYQPSEDHR